jgi:large subunit ribosomal protein L22|uniref:Large ribosomal subunit protein uL22c n=2 Tax=Palmaria TaxID=2821 RepID=A0A1C9CHI0_PALPL|nr:ribosomal protein L22 [Palmaria palmata]YP_009739094.1 50S ribosomal protein L22 [Palmaria decipiens]AOM67831.1 ribosomal protein L22 [Palmaria palmata]QIC19533.1 50S ribosomal protein L22 [Palmaria decipiens]BBI37234.1 50S ribosomal protein L22 [Palmaria palmata]
MIKQKNEIIAIGKYLRLSPIKASRVLNQIRGKTYQDAIIMLQFMPYRACINVKKILESAASNAEHNHGLQKTQLIIKQAYVNQGPTMKRFQPRAQGRAFPIHKPTCHITLSVINQIENN